MGRYGARAGWGVGIWLAAFVPTAQAEIRPPEVVFLARALDAAPAAPDSAGPAQTPPPEGGAPPATGGDASPESPAPAPGDAEPAAGTPGEGETPADGTPGEGETPAPGEGEAAEGTPGEGEAAEGTPGEGEVPVAEEETPAEVEPTPEPEPVVMAAEPEATASEDEPALDPRPRHRWIYSNFSAARVNPLGLVNEFTTGYRLQLIDKDSALFRDSFLAAQLHTYITPAYGRIGPKIDIQPLALLNLSATYDYTGYFGSFGLFQSFGSATEEWSDSELARRDDSGDPSIDNYSTSGHHVTLSMLLQAKVKRIAVRDNLKFYYASYNLREGDRVYYHQTIDLPMPNNGWALTNDADVLYLFDFGLTLGVRYTLTHAFYREDHFFPNETVSRPNGPTHRVGPAMLYTFFDRPDKRFNKPTLIVLFQWWAKHRFRTGQDVSAGVPYFVLGFRFQGDLLPDPATWNKKTEKKPRKRRGKAGK